MSEEKQAVKDFTSSDLPRQEELAKRRALWEGLIGSDPRLDGLQYKAVDEAPHKAMTRETTNGIARREATERMQTASTPELPRGSVLQEARQIINGERQDQYGSPENSFRLIAEFWTGYLRASCCTTGGLLRAVKPGDVAVLMTLLKIAREAMGSGKRDNIVDACGYLGLYGDMEG